MQLRGSGFRFLALTVLELKISDLGGSSSVNSGGQIQAHQNFDNPFRRLFFLEPAASPRPSC